MEGAAFYHSKRNIIYTHIYIYIHTYNTTYNVYLNVCIYIYDICI